MVRILGFFFTSEKYVCVYFLYRKGKEHALWGLTSKGVCPSSNLTFCQSSVCTSTFIIFF